MKTTLALMAAALMFCGCSTSMQKQPTEESLNYFRDLTPQAVKEACTNDVAGLKQITGIDINNGSDDFEKWQASATVDYLDKTGSEQQMQLGYTFFYTGNDLYCVRKY